MFALLVLALIAGSIAWLRPAESRGDLVVWVFADSHARSYRGDGGPATRPSLIDQYRNKTGRRVSVRLIGGQAMLVRLNAIFDRDQPSQDVPDLVELEISTAGRFFRPPVDRMGLLPLNDLLHSEGWDDRLLKARLAAWSKQGVIFGVPHDVHPVAIAYRKDLFDEAGVDLAAAMAWPDFQQRCLQFQAYWRRRGYPARRAIELPSRSSEYVACMLLQQHLNLLDSENHSSLTDPRVASAIEFYARCVAGVGKIGGEATPGANLWVRDFAQGDLCALICPDWRSGYLPVFAPELAGKVRLMPLPRFDPADAPTATLGGTMIGIPRQAREVAAAWDLLKFLYFSPEGLEARLAHTKILPPLKQTWSDPVWHQPDPYFGGQKTSELHIELAKQLPVRFVSPFAGLAGQILNQVLSMAVDQVETGDERDLSEKIRAWCEKGDRELRRRIEFATFEN